MTEDEKYQARLELIATLVWEFYPCDENGEYSEQVAIEKAHMWNELDFEQLQEAAMHILLSKSPLRKIMPRPENALPYPLKARPTLEVVSNG